MSNSKMAFKVGKAKKTSVLEMYFMSSRNASNRGPLELPSPSKHVQFGCGLEASSSSTKDVEGDCSILARANVAVKLLCPGSLPITVQPVNAKVKLDGMEIIDITNEGPTDGKKKKKSYEVSRKCQDAWAIQHPWAKMLHGDCDTIVHRVRCVICTSIRGQDVTMGPKSDTLEKHAG
jgi:hypothetical protein